MCLAIPGKIVSISGNTAKIDISGIIREADLTLLPEADIGDYIILHAGFAIEKYSEKDAEQTWQILREIADGNRD